ncbi:MAG: ABC transporter ATP-binding protein, partial [Chloroflexi bacterium]|nr:ABC transporter ATP-binding protein [Chloroflexota bacterium]
HVSKRFLLRHERPRTFQELAVGLLRLRPRAGEEFWALRDVSFTVEGGRTLGIVGRNGSGKSTLLKLLARTLRPTSGAVQAEGRVFGLLELGTGFHPDLSGRDNVFLNGSFLGLSRREMSRRFDEIVSFAELERFIDTPVKHYSSGMYMRLGFSVAVHVEPDILIIDEVLAVGDARFQEKCLGVLDRFRQEGRTLLLVSHDLDLVQRFCDRAVYLHQGAVRGLGPTRAVVRQYLDTLGGE